MIRCTEILRKNYNMTTWTFDFVKVSVDEKEVAKSEKKPSVPSPRWEWQEDDRL
jgi:hypothetical protein